MPLCSQQLDASLESPAQPLGRVTVKVRCEGSAPWTVFVPATVRLFRDVVVVTRPLKRDNVVDEGDVALRERDVGTLGQGFLTELEQAVGMKMLRPTVIDQVLTPQHLEQAEVVRKGDHVVIIARSGPECAHARRSPEQGWPERTDPGAQPQFQTGDQGQGDRPWAGRGKYVASPLICAGGEEPLFLNCVRKRVRELADRRLCICA